MGYFLDLGYSYSLSEKSEIFSEVSATRSLNSQGTGLISNPQEYYNQTISINLGYRYRFGL